MSKSGEPEALARASPELEADEPAVKPRALLVNESIVLRPKAFFAVGKPPPTLPVWLTEDVASPLDLERSYEEACGPCGFRDAAPVPCSRRTSARKCRL